MDMPFAEKQTKKKGEDAAEQHERSCCGLRSATSIQQTTRMMVVNQTSTFYLMDTHTALRMELNVCSSVW